MSCGCSRYLEWFFWRRPCTLRTTRRRSDSRTRSLRTPGTGAWARGSGTRCSRSWLGTLCDRRAGREPQRCCWRWSWSWRGSRGSETGSRRRRCSRCCPTRCRGWRGSRCCPGRVRGSAGRLWAAHRSGTEGHQRRTHPKDWCEVEQVSKGLVCLLITFTLIYERQKWLIIMSYFLTDSVGSLYIHIFNVNCMNYGPVKQCSRPTTKKRSHLLP